MNENQAQTSRSELIVMPPPQTAEVSAFASMSAFESAQRMANALSKSMIVPKDYQNNISNCLVALEISQRTGSSVLAVMQSLHIIHGRPSWASQYVIAAINSSGRFAPLRYEIEELGEKTVTYEYWVGEKGNRTKRSDKVTIQDKRVVAWTTDRSGERLESPPITIEMAVHEGWYTKSDSKWKTMPDLMLRYRAAAFFGRLYAPDILMGMHAEDELIDVTPSSAMETNTHIDREKTAQGVREEINARIRSKKSNKPSVEKSEPPPMGDESGPSPGASENSKHENVEQTSPGADAAVGSGEEFF